jgi:hypothetical protein
MVTLVTALQRLARAAPDFVDVRAAAPTSLHADVTVGTSESRMFELEIALEALMLQVRERRPTLPLWCPDRHIVRDGEFCLGRDWSCPTDDRRAAEWWLSLALYLEFQMDVEHTRAWPERHAWRHAAFEQQAVEEILGAMSQTFQDDVRSGKTLLLDQTGRPVMRLRNGKLEGDVPRLPRRGPGGRPLYRKERERQNDLLKMLALALNEMVAAEDAFWASARAAGHICCGTMDGCPLRLPPDTTGHAA